MIGFVCELYSATIMKATHLHPPKRRSDTVLQYSVRPEGCYVTHGQSQRSLTRCCTLDVGGWLAPFSCLFTLRMEIGHSLERNVAGFRATLVAVAKRKYPLAYRVQNLDCRARIPEWIYQVFLPFMLHSMKLSKVQIM